MRQIFKKCFPLTIPILFGYLSLGFAFGILLSSAGYGPVWAFFMAIFIFAGTGQFLCVEFLAVGASIPQVIILTVLLNFRHFFYGLSMIDRFKNGGIWKIYSIFGMTDETFGLLTSAKLPTGVDRHKAYFVITLLDHIYWIMGCVLGATIGTLVEFNSSGVDFAMTALFVVLVIEQWKANQNHIPALLGFLITEIALLIFGADNFLIPTLIVISFVLLVLRDKIDKEGEEAKYD